MAKKGRLDLACKVNFNYKRANRCSNVGKALIVYFKSIGENYPVFDYQPAANYVLHRATKVQATRSGKTHCR